MVKVGIMSMQRIANYGSFLQAYGLKCMLEELGCKVEFVDYHVGKTLVRSNDGTGLRRKITKVFKVITYNASLKNKITFIKYKKNFAAKYHSYLGISNKMNYQPELDILIIGSDEVFNCVQDNTNVGLSPELFGVGNRANKVVTYAASFGNTTLEKLEMYDIDSRVAKWLMGFDNISVRDNNSGVIVEKLTRKKPEYHLDPVLMYDFINKCVDIPKDVSDKNYMILYGYSGRFTKDECKVIRAYANSNGLKVFCIGGVQGCCDRFIDCNPFSVIAYFQHAKCVVTDTFHGTILSVITHKKFVSFVRNEGYGNSEKMIDLMNRLNIKSQMIFEINDLAKIISCEPDYHDIDKIIELERKRTQEYLKNNILI